MKTLDLNKEIVDLDGKPFPGKPEFHTDKTGAMHPVYGEDGKQSRLNMTLSDFVCQMLCDVADDLLDDTAIAWAMELRETGKITVDDAKGELKWFKAFVEKLQVTRVVRWRIKQLMAQAELEAVVKE